MDSHLILTGKGGAGKSFAARQLHEYFAAKGYAVHGFDTDPVNSTYADNRLFNAVVVPLLDESNTIDPRRFDEFFEHVATLPEEEDQLAVVIVDNGAASFLPFCSYMAECPALPVLKRRGRVFLHAIVTAGALQEAWDNLGQLSTYYPDVPIVVWLNPYFGEIVNSAGQGFEEMPEFARLQEHIHALVKVPALSRATYGRDMEQLIKRRQTYDEALNDTSGQWSLMSRERLAIIRREMASALDRANVE